MKTILLAVVAIALILAAGPDVTGKWSGTFHATGPDGEARESTALLILQQTGTDITGSFGPSEADQMPIGKGKMDGDKVTITGSSEGRTVTFDLVLANDHLKGDVSLAHGDQVAKAKLDVTRAK